MLVRATLYTHAVFILVCPIIFPRGLRLRMSLALIGGACLTIAPLTIRNAVVFGHFIPVSLGAGQTLLEGIADYDETGSLGVPDTDIGLMKQEAEFHNRPDYALTLFGTDAIQRDGRGSRAAGRSSAHIQLVLYSQVRRADPMWRWRERR